MSQAIKLWDIHGGIHPAENKEQSSQQPIRRANLPKKLYLPLQQHIGSPSELSIKVGDKVLKGQRIADANGFISASLHAPSSGTVVAIENRAIPHPSGLSAETLIIETDGEETWCEREVIEDYRHADPKDLLNHIRNHGITGMGGAGFPTSVKLTAKDDDHIDTLIINGAECEPYITADHLLMRERADQIIEGIGILGHVLKPRRCIIGVENNKMDAVEALKASIESHPNTLPFEVVVAAIPTKYPSGGEKQLIQILTGKEVPHGGIPADLGIVCQNVGTVAAVAKAVLEGEPLISRITTVTGDAVADKGNFETLIGTSIADLLYQCGLDEDDLHRLIMGGPMMGFALQSTDLPVIKTTNCILAATEAEFPNPAQAQDCIRCGMCAEACPAELLPQQLYWFSRGKEFDKAKHFNLFDCIECGACSFVCPSHIPLVQYFRFAKGSIRTEEQAHIKSDRAKMRFEARQERLAKEEAEKEARRKARAEAAAKAKAEKEKAAAAQAEASSENAEDDKKAAIAAAVARAKTKKGADTSAPSVDLKALKVESSQARAAYLKAQRTLDAAKEAGELTPEQVSEQEAEIAKLKQAYDDAKAKMDAARTGGSTTTTPTESNGPDLKALKVASSQARAAHLKAQRALDAAKEAGELSDDEIKAQEADVAKLLTAYESAKKALDEAKSGKPGNTPSAETTPEDSTDTQPAVDIKALKVASSQARAAHLKAQRALDADKEAGELSEEEIKSQETEVAKLQATYETAKKALDDAKNGVTPNTDTTEKETANASVSKTLDQKYKEMKVQASQARAAAKQAQKAVDEAKEAGQGEGDIKALEDALAAAVQNYEKLNAKKLVLQEKVKLQKEAPAAKSNSSEPAEATAEPSKATAEPSKATAEPSKATAELSKATAELSKATAEALTKEDPAQKAKELKVAASQAKAAWRKLERELSSAQEAGDDTSALESQVAEAKEKYDQANEAKMAAMDALKG